MKSELISNNNIILDKFTYISSDYYKNDIVNCYIKLNNIDNKKTIREIKKIKKNDLFNKLGIIIKKFNNYNKFNIIKIQSHIRRYLLYNKFKLMGPGVYNKAMNDDDFYYSTRKREITHIYYFSYNDESNNIWMFDIRSIYKLIKDTIKSYNPYTRLEIPINVKSNIYKIINILKNKNIDIHLEHEKLEANIENKINDIIIKLTSHGYNIEKSWIDSLTLRKMKKLYSSFQDMWYYRLGLTSDIRSQIISDRLFNTNNTTINYINDINKIKIILFQDIYKLINTNNNDYKSTVIMWCLLSFGTIIKNCVKYNQWIHSIL
jgi:hypothetical protein